MCTFIKVVDITLFLNAYEKPCEACKACLKSPVHNLDKLWLHILLALIEKDI